jgi:hypothetical protein
VEADPQDHELASELAIDFYMLGLAEEGDRWANRVTALAPESDVARATRLFGHLAHNDLQAAEASSRSMIVDQVSPRQGAIWDATFIYQQLVSTDGRDSEGLEFFESVRPDIADFSKLPEDQQGTAMQWAAVLFAHRVLGPEVSRDRWARFKANLDASGAGWHKDDETFGIMAPLFEGDIDAAAEVALQSGLSKPVADWISLNDIFRTPIFEPLLSDPRVATRLTERDRELEQARADVLAMLQKPEWQ